MRRLSMGERAALIDGFEFLGELLPPEEHGDYDGRSSPASGLRQTPRRSRTKTSHGTGVGASSSLADETVCDVLENLRWWRSTSRTLRGYRSG